MTHDLRRYDNSEMTAERDKAIANAEAAIANRTHEFFVGEHPDRAYDLGLREAALLREVYDRAFRVGYEKAVKNYAVEGRT